MKPLIIIAGPTAVGKSALAVELAKKIDGEIISADSMQVYRHMDIGSAKIRSDEMQGIRHHMIDVLDPWDEFHVVKFQKMVKECLEDIYSRKKIPILAGGTGFYIQAITKDISFDEEGEDTGYRAELESLAKEKGDMFLHDMLKHVDPKSAEDIHPNNRKRVIRALEYYKQNNQPISAHNQTQKEKESPYNYAYFVLNDIRERIYEKIDLRVDKMMEEGLLEEVQQLIKLGCDASMVSMQGLGYKEIIAYLKKQMSLEEAIYVLKRDTRHFAKRQLTWFKREQDVCWINKNEFQYDENEMLDYMIKIIEDKGII